MSTHLAEDQATLDAQIGERVHQWMFRRRITQTALAPRMGVSQGVLSKKLRGEVAWFARDLVVVASTLDVEVAQLLPAVETQDPRQAGPDGGPGFAVSTKRARRDSNPQPSDP